MHPERFEHDLIIHMSLVSLFQIVVSHKPKQIILLFVFDEHATKRISGMVVTKAEYI